MLTQIRKNKTEKFREWINPKTNDTYKAGELLPRPKLAATLQRLADAGGLCLDFFQPYVDFCISIQVRKT